MLKIYKNMQEYKAFHTGFTVEGIFGGRLLAAKSKEFITFYDWETQTLVRRIDVSPAPRNLYWSENGQQVVLALEDQYYLLNFNQDQVNNYLQNKEGNEEDDGCEEAFDFVEEFGDVITSGLWVSSECFVFTNAKGSIYYLIGQKVIKLVNADKKQFLLGYDQKQNRLYLVDKHFKIVAYNLSLAVVNYQSAILNDDEHGAELFFKEIADSHYGKLARFLEQNDKKEIAFKITPDQDHKFDLAIALNKTEEAVKIADEQENVEKWKKAGDIALLSGYFDLAEHCFKKAQDFNSLFLFYSSYGDVEGLEYVLKHATENGKYNVAFETAYLLGQPETCVEILKAAKRYAEAVMFARSHCPEKIASVQKLWNDVLVQSKLPFSSEEVYKSGQKEGVLET